MKHKRLHFASLITGKQHHVWWGSLGAVRRTQSSGCSGPATASAERAAAHPGRGTGRTAGLRLQAPCAASASLPQLVLVCTGHPTEQPEEEEKAQARLSWVQARSAQQLQYRLAQEGHKASSEREACQSVRRWAVVARCRPCTENQGHRLDDPRAYGQSRVVQSDGQGPRRKDWTVTTRKSKVQGRSWWSSG